MGINTGTGLQPCSAGCSRQENEKLDTTTRQTGHEDHAEKTIDYTVDGRDFTTDEKELTPTTIMTLAGIDAGTHFLTEVLKDKSQVSLEGQNDVAIKMKDDMVFVSAKTGPTGVS